jgi:prepilin-type N-terminal cleavage/methylation domain-containing protein
MSIRGQNPILSQRAAFTLIEVLVASGLASILMLAVMSFAFFSNRSFASLTNYVDLDQRTQLALDKMSQQIRQVNSLTSFSSTNLVFQDFDGATLQYDYDSSKQTLTRTKNSASETLLTGCDFLQFSVYQRNPSNATFQPFSTSSADTTKAIELTWNCSRKILGSSANSECMQSAKVVIRKK